MFLVSSAGGGNDMGGGGGGLALCTLAQPSTPSPAQPVSIASTPAPTKHTPCPNNAEVTDAERHTTFDGREGRKPCNSRW